MVYSRPLPALLNIPSSKPRDIVGGNNWSGFWNRSLV